MCEIHELIWTHLREKSDPCIWFNSSSCLQVSLKTPDTLWKSLNCHFFNHFINLLNFSMFVILPLIYYSCNFLLTINNIAISFETSIFCFFPVVLIVLKWFMDDRFFAWLCRHDWPYIVALFVSNENFLFSTYSFIPFCFKLREIIFSYSWMYFYYNFSVSQVNNVMKLNFNFSLIP